VCDTKREGVKRKARKCVREKKERDARMTEKVEETKNSI